MKMPSRHARGVLPHVGAVALGESIGTPYVDESMYVPVLFLGGRRRWGGVLVRPHGDRHLTQELPLRHQ